MQLYLQVVGMNKSQWQGWICYALLTFDFIEILEMTITEKNLRELLKIFDVQYLYHYLVCSIEIAHASNIHL